MAGCYFTSPVLTGFIARYLNFAWAFRIICGAIILFTPKVHRRFRVFSPTGDTLKGK
jgi:hypothetical protein